MFNGAVARTLGAVGDITREGAKSLGGGLLNMAMEPGESLVTGARQIGTPGHRMEGLGEMAKGVGKAALMIGAPEAGDAVLNAIPRASRAAENFEKAMALARHEPVDVSHFAQPVLRAKHINAVAGDPLAPVMRKALAQVGPTTNPLTYEDARILASSAGRKAQEVAMSPNRLTGEMGKRLGETGKGLDVATQEAASRVSPEAGAYHAKGMKEYAQANALKEGAKKVAKVALPLAGVGALYRGYKELKP
jgi:hypothetical protein